MLHLTLILQSLYENDFQFNGPPHFILKFHKMFTFLYIYTYIFSCFSYKLIYIFTFTISLRLQMDNISI